MLKTAMRFIKEGGDDLYRYEVLEDGTEYYNRAGKGADYLISEQTKNLTKSGNPITFQCFESTVQTPCSTYYIIPNGLQINYKTPYEPELILKTTNDVQKFVLGLIVNSSEGGDQ